VFGLIAVVYLFDLGDAPVYFGGDEAHFAVVGKSLAATGRNLNGDVMPLFFNLADPAADLTPLPWGNTWYQPLLFYLVAMVLTVAPLSEFAVRLPTAIIGGVITPILVYLVAHRLFKRREAAVFAAVVFALTPPQLILSRQALDYVCPLPFVLGWLWFLIDYTETRRLKSAVIGALLLGLGFYSYIASWVMMPIYLALSALVFYRAGGQWWRPMFAAAAGFSVPILVFLPWLWFHPAMLQETFNRYQMSDQDQVSMIQEPGNAFRRDKVAATLTTYWSHFDPGFLFLTGGPNMTTSTGRVGVFLFPLAVLLPLGALALIRRRDPFGFHALILLGILTAPFAATLKGQPFTIQRVLYMLPFVSLVAAVGFSQLWDLRHRAAQALAIALIAGLVIQFGVFYRDFFTHYPLRSAFYYDPAAFEDVAEYMMADTQAPLIYLSDELDDVGAKWRYYTGRDGRQDLMARTRYVRNDGLDIGPSDAGSLLAIYTKTEPMALLEASGMWKKEKVIADVDNRETVAIFRKLR
jgi:4-amino-4-deoxy-L-arabinose transferase-like glycosyltransferase